MSVFSKILTRNLDDVEAPKTLPVGSYTFKVSLKVKAPKNEDDDGYVQGIFIPTVAKADVNPDEIAAFGDLENARVFNRFWLRDGRDEWKMKQFLKLLGVETAGRTLLEAIQAADGYLIDAAVEHDPNPDDPERPYERVSGFAAASV